MKFFNLYNFADDPPTNSDLFLCIHYLLCSGFLFICRHLEGMKGLLLLPQGMWGLLVLIQLLFDD